MPRAAKPKPEAAPVSLEDAAAALTAAVDALKEAAEDYAVADTGRKTHAFSTEAYRLHFVGGSLFSLTSR